MNGVKVDGRLFNRSGCLNREAILLYLQKGLTEAGETAVNKHLDECPLCKDAVEGLKMVNPKNAENSLRSLHQKLHQKLGEHKLNQRVNDSRQLKKSFPWFSIAASLILFLGVYYYFRFYMVIKKDHESTFVQQLDKSVQTNDTGKLNESQSTGLLAVGGIQAPAKREQESTTLSRQTPAKLAEAYAESDKVLNIADNNLDIEQNTNETAVNESSEIPELKSAPVSIERSMAIKEEEVEGNEVFTIVEQMPEFPGGQDSLMKFLVKNLHYPEISDQSESTFTVFVQFKVDSTGRVVEPKILRSAGKEFDAEALRVVKLMTPWIPAHQRGKPVNVLMTLPVRFKPAKR
jgi:TonB family protein